MSLSLVLKCQTPSINWTDTERPWHPSADSGHTYTHIKKKLSNHILSATSTDMEVLFRFRLTHFSPHVGGSRVGVWEPLFCAQCTLVPLWTGWCLPSSLPYHWRTACTQLNPVSLLLQALLSYPAVVCLFMIKFILSTFLYLFTCIPEFPEFLLYFLLDFVLFVL